MGESKLIIPVLLISIVLILSFSNCVPLTEPKLKTPNISCQITDFGVLTISWENATNEDIQTYELYRSESADEDLNQSTLLKNTDDPSDSSYIDNYLANHLGNNTYYYRLKTIYKDGNSFLSPASEQNPFNCQTLFLARVNNGVLTIQMLLENTDGSLSNIDSYDTHLSFNSSTIRGITWSGNNLWLLHTPSSTHRLIELDPANNWSESGHIDLTTDLQKNGLGFDSDNGNGKLWFIELAPALGQMNKLYYISINGGSGAFYQTSLWGSALTADNHSLPHIIYLLRINLFGQYLTITKLDSQSGNSLGNFTPNLTDPKFIAARADASKFYAIDQPASDQFEIIPFTIDGNIDPSVFQFNASSGGYPVGLAWADLSTYEPPPSNTVAGKQNAYPGESSRHYIRSKH